MIIRLFICSMVIVSSNIMARDYSLSALNAKMHGLMQPIEDQRRQRQDYQLRCVGGDDNACVAVGMDPNDPCRPYVNNESQLLTCRYQQCNAGNQDSCDKLEAYNKRMDAYIQSENNRIDRKSHNLTSSCESQCGNVNRNCGHYTFGSSTSNDCDLEYRTCMAGCK